MLPAVAHQIFEETWEAATLARCLAATGGAVAAANSFNKEVWPSMPTASLAPVMQ